MKLTRLTASCFALLTVGATSTFASSDWKSSFNVGLTSDYVYHGITQTDDNPAIQGGFDLNHDDGFFAGVWSSNVESDPAVPVNYDGANIEIDTYLGWDIKLEDKTTLTAKYIRYNYPGTNTDTNDTNEASLYLGHDFGIFSGKVGVNHSDDYYGQGEENYWDIAVTIPADLVNVALHYGSTQYDNHDNSQDDYQDYSIGVSRVVKGVAFGATYSGTSGIDEENNVAASAAGDRLTFSATKTF